MKKLLLKITDACRPALKKIFPASFLRAVKTKIYKNTFSDFSEVKLLPPQPDNFVRGVNLITNIRVDSGVGQGSRMAARSLCHSGEPFGIYNTGYPREESMTDTSCDAYLTEEIPYGVNLVYVNYQEYGEVFYHLGRSFFDRKYNIAFWVWELEEFPKVWTGCMDLVDEIWTPSEHSAAGMRKHTTKPVKVMPHAVTAPCDEEADRKWFGLPEDKFLYLAAYDSGSGMMRKNPQAVVESFQKAFSPTDKRVGLVIKISGKAHKDRELLEKTFAEYDNIYFIDKTLSRGQMNSLIRCADVYVSLHRAEGFGLVMAEAMLLGTPCIATNWSANVEFMGPDRACMVDYTLTQVPGEVELFGGEGRWADADTDCAAACMKRLLEDSSFYEKLRGAGQAYVREHLSPERIGERMGQRLREIYDEIGKEK